MRVRSPDYAVHGKFTLERAFTLKIMHTFMDMVFIFIQYCIYFSDMMNYSSDDDQDPDYIGPVNSDSDTDSSCATELLVSSWQEVV